MIPSLMLAVLAAAALRPRWTRLSMLIVALLVATMQAKLFLSPDALWTGGLGILRGTRRGFAAGPGIGAVASWDSLALLVALCMAVIMTATTRLSSASVPGVAGFLGLTMLNGAGSLAAAWSLVVMACTLSGSPLRWRWSAGVASVLLAGAGIAALAVAGLPTFLHAPEGFGGALDGDGIGLVRHMLTGRMPGGQSHLIVAIPLLLLVSAVCLATGVSRDLAFVGAAAGPVLLFKLYPLMELALREGPFASSVVLTAGAMLVVWAGLGHPASPAREGIVCVGGAFALLGARLPVEAVAWTVVWGAAATRQGRALLGPPVPAMMVSGCALASCAAGDPGWFRLSLCLVMAMGVALAVERPRARERWVTGFVVCTALAIAMLPIVASPFWGWWTGKPRPTFPVGVASWIVVGAGYGAGVVMRCALRDMMHRTQIRLARIRNVAVRTVAAWTAPAVDTAAVLWVATERFGWQGLTLWLPRRAAGFGSIAVAWFQTVVVPDVGRIPLHGIALAAWCTSRTLRTPGVVVLVIAAMLAFVWVF